MGVLHYLRILPVLLSAVLPLAACGTGDEHERAVRRAALELKRDGANKAALERAFLTRPLESRHILEAFLRNGTRFDDVDSLAASYTSSLVSAETTLLSAYERMLNEYEGDVRDRALTTAVTRYFLKSLDERTVEPWRTEGRARKTMLLLNERLQYVRGVYRACSAVAPLVEHSPDQIAFVRSRLEDVERGVEADREKLEEKPVVALVRGWISGEAQDGMYEVSSGPYEPTSYALSTHFAEGLRFTTTGWFTGWIATSRDTDRGPGKLPVFIYLTPDGKETLLKEWRDKEVEYAEKAAKLRYVQDNMARIEEEWGKAVRRIRVQLLEQDRRTEAVGEPNVAQEVGPQQALRDTKVAVPDGPSAQ